MLHALNVDDNTARRFDGLARLVGNTPLLAIDFTYRGERRTLYAKAEHLNMTGSIKDRMALHILRRAYMEGTLHPGDTIAEASAGCSGISLSAIGRALGHPVTILMPDWLGREPVDRITALGARVIPVSRADGGFIAALDRLETLGAEPGVYLTRQFANPANARDHEATTGPEIWAQLAMNSLQPDAFAAGAGTGGTVMGVGRFLRSKSPGVKVHAIEPAESPTLSTGRKSGQHRIPGLTDEFVPQILDRTKLDGILPVHDGDAILMAQKLASQLGLGVGISSGANVVGALQLQNQMGPKAVVVTVLPDSNSKYLSGDLLREEPVRDGYLSPDVDLVSFTTFQRVCSVCFEFGA